MKTLFLSLLVVMVCVIPVTSWGRIRVSVRTPIRLPPVRARVSLPGVSADAGTDGSDINGHVAIGKRSIGWNGKHYTVNLDQCYFGSYDLNNDGMIEKEEMITIFGENGNSEELFDALDITTGNGLIDEEEFSVMSERIIDGCQKNEGK